MTDKFDPPSGLIPQNLDAADSRAYEERTVEELRTHFSRATSGLVAMDAIELVGSRPDTLVVFRYHHRPEYVGTDPWLGGAGPRAETAKFWEFAFDPNDPYSQEMMDTPPVLAAAIGTAFDAAELDLVDPDTLELIGSPPNAFPRYHLDWSRP